MLVFFVLDALLFFVLALSLRPVSVFYDMTTLQWHVAFQQVPSPLLFLALTPPLVYLSTLVHESGHLVASLLMGSWVQFCRVGPFTITRTRQGLRLGLSASRMLGGAVGGYPADGPYLLLRRAIIALAGPVASLLMATAAWRLANALYPAASRMLLTASPGTALDGPPLSTGMLLAVSACLFVAVEAALSSVTNLFPYTSGGQASDGLRVMRTLTSPTAARREEALAAMMGHLLRGGRARDWPIELVAQALPRVPDGSAQDARASIMAYTYALDAGDIPLARVFLNRFLSPAHTLRENLPVLALEAAYFIARHYGDPATARTWMALGAGARLDAIMRPRAEAAILLAEGRSAEAYERATQGLTHLLAIRPSSNMAMRLEEDNLRAMQAEAAAHMETSGQPFTAR